LPRFGWRRLTRIYPNYWLVSAVLIVLALLKRDPSLTLAHMIQSLLLVPEFDDPVLGVGWTLRHEILFYAVFAVAIFNRRAGVAVAAIWLGLIAVNLVAPFDDWRLQFVAYSYNLQFLFGVMAGHLVASGGVKPARLLAVIGAAGFLAVGVAENAGLFPVAGPATQVLFGLCAAALIVGLASAETQGTIRVGAFAAFLGGASYSIYLVHTLTITLFAQLLMRTGTTHLLPGGATLLAASVLAVLSGCLLYVVFERPLMNRLASLARAGRAREMKPGIAIGRPR